MLKFLRSNIYFLVGAALLAVVVWTTPNPFLGLPGLTLFLFGIFRNRPDPISALRAVISAFALWLAVCLLAVYFFTLSPLIIFIGLLTVVGQQLWLGYFSHQPDINPDPPKPAQSFKQRFFLELPVILVVGICLLIAWSIGRLDDGRHVYQGLVAPGWPPILTAIPALVLMVLTIVPRSRGWIIGAIALWIALNSFYVTRLDTLYGADSWRHFGKIVRVDSGQPYAPTNLSEIVKLNNEKIPNASLYTLLPLLHRTSGIETLILYKYGAIGLFGPLLILVMYVATKELTNRRRAAQLVVLAGFLAPGFYSLEGYLNVRTVGLVLLAVHSWLWLRYCLGRYRSSWWELGPVTLVTVLSYPTTGYIGLVIALLALALKKFSGWKSRWPSLALTLGLGLSFAVVIPYLDISRMGVRVQSVYQNEWWRIIYVARDWFQNSLNLHDIVMSSFAVIFFAGLIWLWWRHHDRIFILVGTITVVALVDIWMLTTFTDNYAPFSSRMPMILSMLMTVLFGLGLERLLVLLAGRNRRLYQLAIGLVLVALLVQKNQLALTAIGWTPSNNEVRAVEQVISQNFASDYRVLADETTEAVGYALAPKTETSWSWYPNNVLASTANQFIAKPSRAILNQACHLSGLAKRVYFLKTPIPPASSMNKASLKKVEDLMFRTGNYEGVEVYLYDCPTS